MSAPRRRASAADLTFGAPTAPTRDASADARPHARTDVSAREGTPASQYAQAATPPAERPVSGTAMLAATRASVSMQRRAIENARRALDVAARVCAAAQARAAERVGELEEARALAEGAGLTPEEIRAVVLLAGVSPDVLSG